MLADTVLAIHLAMASAIVAGFILVPLGARRGWRWVRHRTLRLLHLWAMVFIAAETLAGVACPLTRLEDALRGAGDREAGFIQHWLGALLYWNLPPWVFVAGYLALAIAAVLMWYRIPVTPRP